MVGLLRKGLIQAASSAVTVTVFAGTVFAGTVFAGTVLADAAQARNINTRDSLLCRSYQHITVSSGNAQYVVRNDNYGHDRECLRNSGGAPDFAVVVSGARVEHSEPVAYPNIFVGCSWGICTPRSHLPVQVDRIKSVVTTWHTKMKAKGIWSAGYDIWFDRRPCTSGQSGGAELMIWLNARGFDPGSWPVVRVDHTRWYLEHWVTSGHGKHWNYIQFRRVHGTAKVTRLRVAPFITVARQHGLISKKWWLTTVMAGFEIWRGGVGLSTTRFMVHV